MKKLFKIMFYYILVLYMYFDSRFMLYALKM